jgi:hypothetical protein
MHFSWPKPILPYEGFLLAHNLRARAGLKNNLPFSTAREWHASRLSVTK